MGKWKIRDDRGNSIQASVQWFGVWFMEREVRILWKREKLSEKTKLFVSFYYDYNSLIFILMIVFPNIREIDKFKQYI